MVVPEWVLPGLQSLEGTPSKAWSIQVPPHVESLLSCPGRKGGGQSEVRLYVCGEHCPWRFEASHSLLEQASN